MKLATNLHRFNLELSKAADKVSSDLNRFYKLVTLEVLRRIVLRTPVDTGRARGNWQLEVGRPASGELDISGDEGSTADFAINSGESKLSLIPIFSLVHITNNVEYVYFLEYDKHSPKSPEGMVEITLTEMETWLSGIR